MRWPRWGISNGTTLALDSIISSQIIGRQRDLRQPTVELCPEDLPAALGC